MGKRSDRKRLEKLYGVNTNFLETWFENNDTIAQIMGMRCRVTGCQFGIEGLDKEPKEKCIWCGRERPFHHFKGVSIPDLVKEHNDLILKTKEDEK